MLKKHKTKAFLLRYRIVQRKTSLRLADRHMTPADFSVQLNSSNSVMTILHKQNSPFQTGHASSVGFGHHWCHTQNTWAQKKHLLELQRPRDVWKAAVRFCMCVGCQEKLGWCQSNYLVHQSFRKYTEKPKTRC